MIVAVVGAAGIVGRTLVEHFEHLGHKVLQVERSSRLTLEEAAKVADVVFVVTRPIAEVGILMERAARAMRPGKLLVHGTSVECPGGRPVTENWSTDRDISITVCHFHVHFRPLTPLKSTLLGQHITMRVWGPKKKQWERWLCDSFAPYGPFIHKLRRGEHDKITSVSQLLHMVVAFIIGWIWPKILPPQTLLRGLTIGGPPCRLLMRMVLRVASGPGVVAEILTEHPMTMHVIGEIRKALDELECCYEERDPATLEARLRISRQQCFSPEGLADHDRRTAQLARMEADLDACTVGFDFPTAQNQPGLLARVLGEFSARGVDLTTTIAQTNPDGSCTFVIGIREDSPAVAEAVAVINAHREG